MAKPKNLRQALNQISDMLSDRRYSEDLWAVLTGLRGPDSRNRRLKYATTAIIRDAAFPKRPGALLSVFGKDSKKLTKRRINMFAGREDFNHFREHVRDSFSALKLDLLAVNVLGISNPEGGVTRRQ